MSAPARVAILGAESSGKSTLAAALAARHDTLWVPEYLRQFVEERQRVPRESDQLFIAAMQRRLEDEMAAMAAPDGLLFCDTTPLMTAVYSGYYFHGVDTGLAALAARHDYGWTLVTAPDTPWEADGLQRESEAVRQLVHQRLIAELARRGIAYALVHGALEQRLAQAEAWLAAAPPSPV
jgi:NadR type nicotinamide-nucleotide adenylyltransferase